VMESPLGSLRVRYKSNMVFKSGFLSFMLEVRKCLAHSYYKVRLMAKSSFGSWP
jgi:hypothetical protein